MEIRSEDKSKMRCKDMENMVDEHIPDVYGPPSWYRSDGNMPLEDKCDNVIPNVYGPIPPKEKTVINTEFTDKPIPKVYGPDSSFKPQTTGNDEDGIGDSQGILVCKLKIFFSRLFGKFSKN